MYQVTAYALWTVYSGICHALKPDRPLPPGTTVSTEGTWHGVRVGPGPGPAFSVFYIQRIHEHPTDQGWRRALVDALDALIAQRLQQAVDGPSELGSVARLQSNFDGVEGVPHCVCISFFPIKLPVACRGTQAKAKKRLD